MHVAHLPKQYDMVHPSRSQHANTAGRPHPLHVLRGNCYLFMKRLSNRGAQRLTHVDAGVTASVLCWSTSPMRDAHLQVSESASA